MGEILIAIHVVDGKLESKYRMNKANSVDLSLSITTLELLKKKQIEIYEQANQAKEK